MVVMNIIIFRFKGIKFVILNLDKREFVCSNTTTIMSEPDRHTWHLYEYHSLKQI